MEKQSVTVNLPKQLYRRLERLATATNQSLDAVLLQTIRGNLPPFLEDVPAPLRAEFSTLTGLADDDLWAIARVPIDQRAWNKHRRLLEKNSQDDLNPKEKRELEQLRASTDQIVLRRSFAIALLKWRGYTIQIPIQAENAKS